MFKEEMLKQELYGRIIPTVAGPIGFERNTSWHDPCKDHDWYRLFV